MLSYFVLESWSATNTFKENNAEPIQNFYKAKADRFHHDYQHGFSSSGLHRIHDLRLYDPEKQNQ